MLDVFVGSHVTTAVTESFNYLYASHTKLLDLWIEMAMRVLILRNSRNCENFSSSRCSQSEL